MRVSSGTSLAIFVPTAVTLLAVAGGVSAAVADPGGWAAWRVALTVWPIGLGAGLFVLMLVYIVIAED